MAARKKSKRGRKSAPPSGGGLWLPKLGLAGMRLFVGAIFLRVAWFKLVEPGLSLGATLRRFAEGDVIPLFRNAAANPPVVLGWKLQWFADFIDAVMLPGNAPYVFGTAFLAFEVLLGLGLVLGVCARLLAGLGVLVMLFSGLAKGMYFLTIREPGANWMLMVMLFVLAATAAGRIWGLDSRLRYKLPTWIS